MICCGKGLLACKFATGGGIRAIDESCQQLRYLMMDFRLMFPKDLDSIMSDWDRGSHQIRYETQIKLCALIRNCIVCFVPLRTWTIYRRPLNACNRQWKSLRAQSIQHVKWKLRGASWKGHFEFIWMLGLLLQDKPRVRASGFSKTEWQWFVQTKYR